MQYFGGKKRIAKQIVKFISPYLKNKDYYLEPFVGSCAVIENIEGIKRYGSDYNEYLIELYKALQNGWIPPENLSEDEYQYIKNNKDDNKALTAFAGIGCSYAGKWFAGYCRNKRMSNYAKNCYNTLLHQLPKIMDIDFSTIDYKLLNPTNALIYCDPPYANTKTYEIYKNFDHEEFWNVMREWSKNNTVFISEYIAPEDFTCALEITTRTVIRDKNNEMIPRIEKLFTKNNI
jgi:DNA adenine methylase